MSLLMHEALEGLNETDSFAAEYEAGFGRADELTSTACACRCCVICTGVVAFIATPASNEIEIAA
jgi:hypothetical protein